MASKDEEHAKEPTKEPASDAPASNAPEPTQPGTGTDPGKLLCGGRANLQSDCKLIERYGIPDGRRDEVVETLLEIARTAKKPREKLMAVRALLGADRVNIEVTKLKILQKQAGDVPQEETEDKAAAMMRHLRAMQASVPKFVGANENSNGISGQSNGQGSGHHNGNGRANSNGHASPSPNGHNGSNNGSNGNGKPAVTGSDGPVDGTAPA